MRERITADGADRAWQNLTWQSQLGFAAARFGFGEATHFFSMLAEFPTLLVAAKERGLCTVSEVYILLATERILAEEKKAFPGWEPQAIDFDRIRRSFSSEDVLLTKTDYFICPSKSVRDDLIQNRGIKPESAAVVPYGAGTRVFYPPSDTAAWTNSVCRDGRPKKGHPLPGDGGGQTC